MKALSKSINLVTFKTGTFACNTSILWDNKSKEAIIIDSGNDDAIIKAKLIELGLNVKYLLYTHAHFDHIGKAKEVAEVCKGKICLHKDDEILYQGLKAQGQMFGMSVSEPTKIDKYLLDEEEFNLGSENYKIKTLHTPGHTDGSCSFYLNTGNLSLLFSGDTLFYGSVGRCDLPFGDFEKIKRSIKNRIYTLPEETQVIAGHGQNTSIGFEKRSNPFVNA